MTLYTHWTPCWQIISIVVTITGRCWHLKGPDLTDAERPKYFGQFTRGLAWRASLRHFNYSTSQCLYDRAALPSYLLQFALHREDLFRDCKWSTVSAGLMLPLLGCLCLYPAACSLPLIRSHLRPGQGTCEDLIIIRIWAEETRRARFQNMHY